MLTHVGFRANVKIVSRIVSCRIAGTRRRRPQLSHGHLATNQSLAAAAVDWWDRQTDGRTPDRFLEPALHTTRTVSINCTL